MTRPCNCDRQRVGPLPLGDGTVRAGPRAGSVPSSSPPALAISSGSSSRASSWPRIRHSLGDYESAIAHFLVNIEMESLDESLRGRRAGPGILSIVGRRWLAQSLTEVGRFTEGIALATEAVEMAETADHPFSLTNALAGLGLALVRKGDVERAIPLLERGSEVSRRLSFHSMWVTCAIPLAAAYGLSGRSAEAIRVLPDVPLGACVLQQHWGRSPRAGSSAVARTRPAASARRRSELARARKKSRTGGLGPPHPRRDCRGPRSPRHGGGRGPSS